MVDIVFCIMLLDFGFLVRLCVFGRWMMEY